MRHTDDRQLRRLAIQLATQLPENEADALRVLALTRELVTGFMEGREALAEVVPLRGIG